MRKLFLFLHLQRCERLIQSTLLGDNLRPIYWADSASQISLLSTRSHHSAVQRTKASVARQLTQTWQHPEPPLTLWSPCSQPCVKSCIYRFWGGGKLKMEIEIDLAPRMTSNFLLCRAVVQVCVPPLRSNTMCRLHGCTVKSGLFFNY